MENHFLSIGQMSHLFGLNKQTLHYYDKIGLFTPEGRDPNGYRLYRFEQCYKLAAIRNMRSLGYSLETISNLMKNLKTEITLEEMEKRLDMIYHERLKLENTEQILKRKMSFIKTENRPEDYDKIEIREFPKRYYLPIGTEDLLYRDESFYLNPTVVFYHGNVRNFGAFIYRQPPEDNLLTQQVFDHAETIPAGQYLCGYHLGPYTDILTKVSKLRQYGINLPLKDWSVHFNIIDQFSENDSSRFVTGIQIPLKGQ
jgi:DNA-binding transcriptional MerR regulator